MKVREAFIKRQIPILITMGIIMLILLILPMATNKNVAIDGKYTSKENVSLYLMKYHELPKNYITSSARNSSGYATGDTSELIVGGDTHWNTGELSDFGISDDASLKECDIYFDGYSNGISSTPARGVLRLVYTANTDDVRVFYTDDHYATYKEITRFDIMPVHYITKYIMITYLVIGSITIAFVYAPIVKDRFKKRVDYNQDSRM